MPELIAAFDAFTQEHRRCGEIDGGVENDRVWMACECGPRITHPVGMPMGRARISTWKVFVS